MVQLTGSSLSSPMTTRMRSYLSVPMLRALVMLPVGTSPARRAVASAPSGWSDSGASMPQRRSRWSGFSDVWARMVSPSITRWTWKVISGVSGT